MATPKRLVTLLSRLCGTGGAKDSCNVVRKSVFADTRKSFRRLPRKSCYLHTQTHSKAALMALIGGGATLTALSVPGVPQGTTEVDKDKTVQEMPSSDADDDGNNKSRKIRLADVKKHDAKSGQPWVTKGTSVYDITDWVGAHPGGEVILRAAGGSIDVYWNIFSIHKKQDVYDILESYLIGQIDPRDLVDGKIPAEAIEDPFAQDPHRDERLKTLTPRPCNAETPGEGLADFKTSNDLFYVRNHMWVPVVKEATNHRLKIELPDGEEVDYTMKDLKDRFQTHKVTATLQCAGNRRKDMTTNAKETNGLQWTAGAISSAEWEGFKLRDILADAGLDIHDPPEDAQHVQFTGLEAYGASIPIDKAIDRKGDVLLAYKMNGEELPPDHGYPLRVIVPGNVAARSVKWLSKIVISDEESQTQWQRRDYRNFGPNIIHPNWPLGTSIQEMPITSAITGIHSDHSSPSKSPLTIEGYAYSGGGRRIIRVDISQDEGKSWDQAELINDEYQGSKAWCWKRWRYTGVVNPSASTSAEKTASLIVKATDETYNTQPQSYTSIFNPRGNLATAWHRVELKGENGDGIERD